MLTKVKLTVFASFASLAMILTTSVAALALVLTSSPAAAEYVVGSAALFDPFGALYP